METVIDLDWPIAIKQLLMKESRRENEKILEQKMGEIFAMLWCMQF